MFFKLIKREFAATYRTMLPLYGAMVVSAGAGRLLDLFGGASESGAMLTVINLVRIMNNLVLVLGAFLTLYVAVQRVYKSMILGEDKLEYSPECTVRKHLYARFSVSMIWCVLSLGFTVFCHWLYRGELPFYIKIFFDTGLGAAANIMACVIILLMIAAIICALYLALGIGNLFGEKRLAGSVISGVVVFAVISAASYFVLKYEILEKVFEFIGSAFVTGMQEYGGFASLLFAAFAVICFEISNKLIGKKLN